MDRFVKLMIFTVLAAGFAITLDGRGSGGHFGGGGMRGGGYGRGAYAGGGRVATTRTTTRAGRVGKVAGAKKVSAGHKKSGGQKMSKAGKKSGNKKFIKSGKAGTHGAGKKIKKGGKGGGNGKHVHHGKHNGQHHHSNICPGCRHPVFYEPGWWINWYPWLAVPWIVAAVQPSQQTIVLQQAAGDEDEADVATSNDRLVSEATPEMRQEYLRIIYKDRQGNLLTEQFVSPDQQETMFIYDPTDHTLIEKRVLDLHGNQTIQKAAQGPITRDDIQATGPVKVVERTVDVKTGAVVKSAEHYEYVDLPMKNGQRIRPAIPARESAGMA